METLLTKIGAGVAGVLMVIAGWFGGNANLAAPVEPVAGQTYTLSGSGISSSATSITLQSLTIPQTAQPLLDADFSDTFFITIEPGNRTRQEIVSCTTVVQNAAGTATLSGCSRGLSPITPYTASTTLQFVHAGGTQVIFSDPPQLFNQYAAKANDELISGLWTASSTSPWRYDADFSVGSTTRVFSPVNWVVDNFLDTNRTGAKNLAGTYTFNTATSTFSFGAQTTATHDCQTGANSLTLCSKSYVDSVALVSAPNADSTTKGVVEEATASEILAGTASGSTGARLYINPAVLMSTNASSTQIVATTSAANMSTTTLRGIPFGNRLQISLNVASTSVQSLRMCFNEDWGGCNASTLYQHNSVIDGVVGGSGSVGESSVLLQSAGGGGAGELIFDFTIYNATSTDKRGTGLGFIADRLGSGDQDVIETGFFWASTTAAVNSVSFAIGSAAGNNSIGAGTVIKAYILP